MLHTCVPLAPERNIICKLFAGNTLRSSPGISWSFSGIINLLKTFRNTTPKGHMQPPLTAQNTSTKLDRTWREVTSAYLSTFFNYISSDYDSKQFTVVAKCTRNVNLVKFPKWFRKYVCKLSGCTRGQTHSCTDRQTDNLKHNTSSI